MELNDLFNRQLLIATKHHKEKVIAPILLKHFNIESFTDPNFDSDLFGTFTSEVERKSDPINTVKLKAKKAIENSTYDLVLASEGSFGPHPNMFFTSCNEEFIYLYDKKNNFEITVKLLSTNTNFLSRELSSKDDFKQFLIDAKFPSHAIILKDNSNSTFFKGISNNEEAFSIFNDLLNKNKKVCCETDMRAMYNPTRIENIGELTDKLVKIILSVCPKCNAPGFQVTEAIKGLLCSLCGFPTSSTLKYISKCSTCNFEQEELFPNKKEKEEPMYCGFCNP
jgi:predicted Zn-ribbon and HTH transcriptional regulator